MECTASGKAKGGAESSLKPVVTYRPQQIRKSTSCLGCSDRRGSAVSSFWLLQPHPKGTKSVYKLELQKLWELSPKKREKASTALFPTLCEPTLVALSMCPIAQMSWLRGRLVSKAGDGRQTKARKFPFAACRFQVLSFGWICQTFFAIFLALAEFLASFNSLRYYILKLASCYCSRMVF